MNPYIFETFCEVCGGRGMATIDSVYGGVHKDPNICRQNLAEKAKELKKKEHELNQKNR